MRVMRHLVVALGVLAVVLVGACNESTTTKPAAPALSVAITASPTTPKTGAVVTLTAHTTPAITSYHCVWAGTAGTFSRTDTTVVQWTAPDGDGTYDVTVVIGDAEKSASAKLSLVVSAYTPPTDPHYVGEATCQGCHPSIATPWSGTLHANAFGNCLTGADAVNPVCLACHTVGFNTQVANGGYDEQAVARLQNVQCENCHGPGSAHPSNPSGNPMAKDSTSALCGSCHDGAHHPTYTEWKSSAHAHPIAGVDKEAGCQCHNGYAAIPYLDNPTDPSKPWATLVPADTVAIGCPVCHDPHSNATNDHQLRNAINDVALPDGVHPAAGAGRLCIACHNSRRTPTNITSMIYGGSSHFGPHHGPQGDMLAGVGAYDSVNVAFHWGSSTHLSIQDGCVNCHTHQHSNPTFMGHNFLPTVEACQPCHGAITDFDQILARDDYNGDGQVQGVQTEVAALLDTLGNVIIGANPDPALQDSLRSYYNTPADHSNFATGIGKTAITTADQRKAGYNYLFVAFDKSMGVHNATYTVELLQQSIKFLRPTAIQRARILTE